MESLTAKSPDARGKRTRENHTCGFVSRFTAHLCFALRHEFGAAGGVGTESRARRREYDPKTLWSSRKNLHRGRHSRRRAALREGDLIGHRTIGHRTREN